MYESPVLLDPLMSDKKLTIDLGHTWLEYSPKRSSRISRPDNLIESHQHRLHRRPERLDYPRHRVVVKLVHCHRCLYRMEENFWRTSSPSTMVSGALGPSYQPWGSSLYYPGVRLRHVPFDLHRYARIDELEFADVWWHADLFNCVLLSLRSKDLCSTCCLGEA